MNHRRTLVTAMLAAALAMLLTATAAAKPADVYFTRDVSGQGVLKVFEKIKGSVRGKTAIKVHFGEEGNQNYLKPELSRPLALQLNATLVETNVLYPGKRHTTFSHLQLAGDHGFSFAPIDILDSIGDRAYNCNLKHYRRVRVGDHISRYNTIVVFSHFKGHGLAGFGGAIKNVAMGLASVAGKMALHASAIPAYDPAKCLQCGACVAACAGNAISLNPLKIDTAKCVGCGKCIYTCPVGSFSVPRAKVTTEVFNQRLAEYAKVIADSNRMVYINVLASISPDCDCARKARPPFTGDIGILASTDIVAIEQASHDLVAKAHKCDDPFLKESRASGKSQIEYAYQLGMGSRQYRLVDLDKK